MQNEKNSKLYKGRTKKLDEMEIRKKGIDENKRKIYDKKQKIRERRFE